MESKRSYLQRNHSMKEQRFYETLIYFLGKVTEEYFEAD